eukprot:TRINITY_DN6291_c0_g1_i3.p1 TRINITY_DN6291_c0_g1~~TRINITY_DN6291_c0_g1_i3.p1  ORF type:complete len:784 (+),score=250.28 TRINITY_DN6291_c0_g1_i3:93-2444(+)
MAAPGYGLKKVGSVQLKPASQRVLAPAKPKETPPADPFGARLKPASERVGKAAANVVTDEKIAEFLATRQAIRDWIEEALEVPLDKQNLGECLRSGVILCYLMLEIDPSSIPKIQENTTQMFKMKENIDFFLDAALELGVKRQKLFMAKDLVEELNIVAVVDCLVEVANCAAGRNFDVPLRVDRYLPDSMKLLEEITPEEKELLKTQISKRKSASPVVTNAGPVKKIEKLDNNKAEITGIAKFQALWRGFKVRKEFKAIKRKLAFREKIIREILSTEKSYVENLNTLITVYFTPLDEAAKTPKTVIISTDEVKSIFSAVLLIIRNFNTKMYAELENRIDKSKSWGPNGCVGDILLKNINQEFLKIYTKYVQNFDSALRVVDKLRRENPKWASFLSEKQKDPQLKGLDLGAYLIQPVQRIPRYNMLLKELVKYTWDNHPDAEDLLQAEQIVAKVAETINEKKREAEQLATILPVAASITNSPIYIPESHRRFLAKAPSSDMKYFVFLFSDILVITKPTTGGDKGSSEAKKKEKKDKDKKDKKDKVMDSKRRGSFLGGLLSSSQEKKKTPTPTPTPATLATPTPSPTTPPATPSPKLARSRSLKFGSSSLLREASVANLPLEVFYEYQEHIPVADLEAVDSLLTPEIDIQCPKKTSPVFPMLITLPDSEPQAEFMKAFRAAKNGDINLISSFSGIIKSPSISTPRRARPDTSSTPTSTSSSSSSSPTTAVAFATSSSSDDPATNPRTQRLAQMKTDMSTSGKTTEQILFERRLARKEKGAKSEAS